MTTVLQQLEQNHMTIAETLKSIREEANKLNNANEKLSSEIAIKRPEVESMDTEAKVEVDVDELILPNTPLERQIFNNNAEDLAIQDLMYELSVALRKDIINVNTFTKEVRKLGRKQFKLRAQIKKARKVGNLSPI